MRVMTRQQIYIAVGVATLIAAAMLGTSLWSTHRMNRLEHQISAARQVADTMTQQADESEKAAGVYKAKIEYLETQLVEINNLVKEQDEKIQKLDIETRNAR